MYHISLNLIHNSSATLFNDEQVFEVIEYERYTNIKNDGAFWGVFEYRKDVTTRILNFYKQKYNIDKFNKLLLNPIDVWNIKDKWNIHTDEEILKFFTADKLIVCDHQISHAAGAYYQSNMDDAIVVSFDGGGNDGNFNIYSANSSGLEFITSIRERVLGERFAYFANYCDSIKKEPSWPLHGSLVYPGKLMGLAAFGKVRTEWISVFEEYYKGYPNVSGTNFEENYTKLKQKLNLPETYSGELEKDIAATSQYMFEYMFYKDTHEYWKNSKNVILAGGCGLNILNNQTISEQKNTYVPPNPSDCGLGLGQALGEIKPKVHIEYAFAGPEAWDKDCLMEYVMQYRGVEYSDELIANEILQGKIIGVVKGRSELGPRALGHRSILCHAAISGMKDILNHKVKNREWYRPFAPLCRDIDANIFFEITKPELYRCMSYCPKVKDKHKHVLESITHVDGTARLQTVSESQNEWTYNLLTTLANKTSYPVLLNTSFNIAGKPILNTYRDAVWMLENTQMDGLILENYYITKRG
jgi:carbamoyltransferase